MQETKQVTTIKERGDKVEEMMCELFNMTPDAYLEMWYEYGCQFAEQIFKEWALTGKAHKRAVHVYICSTVFWYFWAKLWMRSCEKFLMRGLHTRKGFDVFIRNQPRPGKGLHRQIVSNSNAKSPSTLI